MSLDLTTHGRVLFGPPPRTRRKAPLKFDDFRIVRDRLDGWVVLWLDNPHPIAKFTGTYVECYRALKIQLVTSRLLS